MRVRQTFEDLWATSVQHQIDHLNGMIYADRLSKTKRDMLLRKAEEEDLMRIVFMGTPISPSRSLDALVDAGHEIACVYCQPPRPAGRGKKDRPSPVQRRAEALGLPVRHPVSLKSPEAQAEFARSGPMSPWSSPTA
jgi:hypothetical protein